MYGSSRSTSKDKKPIDPLQIRGKAKRESVKLDSAQNYWTFPLIFNSLT